MKYALAGRQPKPLLRQVDEIMIKAQDYRYISELAVDIPNKTIILDVPNEDFEDLKPILIEYNKIEEVNFVCKIYSLHTSVIEWFQFYNIKFYYGYSVNSFYEVQGLVNLGVEYVKIHAPLTFNIDMLKRFDTKFRMVPNVAYDAYIPRKDGMCGQWVRPEDIKHYEEGIYVFEFEDADLEKERTLYNIYAENGYWPGNLNLLITNLNINADNRGLPEEFGEMRANCGQKCMVRGSCHFCETAFRFENMLRTKKNEIEEMIENQKKDEN